MRRLIFSLALIVMVSMPVAAQRFPYHDPDLIEKLYKNDYQHIGNDNLSRQDLIALIAAFGVSKDPKKKCDLVEDQGSMAGGAKLLKYNTFLQSDSRTGQYPSKESRELAFVSALFPDPPYAYVLDPNLVAMANEIDKGGCNSPRVQTIRRNLVQLLDDRMAGRNVPVTAAPPGPQTQARPRPPVAGTQPIPPTPPPTTRPPQPTAPQPAPPPPPPPVQTGIPPRTVMPVVLLEPIDILTTDYNRTYRAKVLRDVVAPGGRIVLSSGAEVVLKLSREQSPQPSIVMVAISAISVVVDGKPVALTTTMPHKAGMPVVPNMPKIELPAGISIALTVESAK
jgi:hypothetical protein